jgi:Fe2+ or Zn2+ uptake regulation protein
MQRSTRQLTTTLEVLVQACDHPTAEQILVRVRERLPRVSLGTVYRNLEKLRAQGQLRVVNIGPGVARYDAVLTEHDHFVCDSCGAVIDLDTLSADSNVSRLQTEGYVVRACSMVVHGLCRTCVSGARPAAAGQSNPARP